MLKSLTLSALTLATLVASAPAAFAGDAAAGEELWRNCRSCHSITAPDGTVIQRGGRSGPNLHGLPGRAIGSSDFGYSDAMQAVAATGAVWDEALFVEYLADPSAFVAAHGAGDGARAAMNFRLAEGAADMWAYLASVSQ